MLKLMGEKRAQSINNSAQISQGENTRSRSVVVSASERGSEDRGFNSHPVRWSGTDRLGPAPTHELGVLWTTAQVDSLPNHNTVQA